MAGLMGKLGPMGSGQRSMSLPSNVAVRPGVNLAPKGPAPLKMPGELETGYVTGSNQAANAWDAQSMDAIGRYRFWDQLVPEWMNPMTATTAKYANPDEKRNFVINETALGTYHDPTFGGATTNVNGLVNNFKGYSPQMVDLGRINQRLDNFGNGYQYERVQAPTAVTLNGADQAQIRAQQMGLLGLLGDAARGNGPSAAQGVLRQGVDENIRSAMALAASARGGSNPAAARAARYQAAGANQAAANQAAILRAQEMQAAQSLYGGTLGGVRGQDQGWAGMQADVGFQNNAQRMQQQGMNQQAGLAANAQNNQFLQGLLGMNLQGQGMNQNAGLAANAQNNSYHLGLLGQQYNYAALGQQGDLARLQALQNQQAFQQAKWEASNSRHGKGYQPILQAVGGGLQGLSGMVTGFKGLLGGGGGPSAANFAAPSHDYYSGTIAGVG